MNCKPGDLAYFRGPLTWNASSWSEEVRAAVKARGKLNRGKIVRCIRLEYTAPTMTSFGLISNIWLVDPPLEGVNGLAKHLPDAWLVPLRDPGDDAVDEMVVIAGKPEHQPA